MRSKDISTFSLIQRYHLSKTEYSAACIPFWWATSKKQNLLFCIDRSNICTRVVFNFGGVVWTFSLESCTYDWNVFCHCFISEYSNCNKLCPFKFRHNSMGSLKKKSPFCIRQFQVMLLLIRDKFLFLGIARSIWLKLIFQRQYFPRWIF